MKNADYLTLCLVVRPVMAQTRDAAIVADRDIPARRSCASPGRLSHDSNGTSIIMIALGKWNSKKRDNELPRRDALSSHDNEACMDLASGRGTTSAPS